MPNDLQFGWFGRSWRLCQPLDGSVLVLFRKKAAEVPGWLSLAAMASTAPGTASKLNVLTSFAAVAAFDTRWRIDWPL